MTKCPTCLGTGQIEYTATLLDLMKAYVEVRNRKSEEPMQSEPKEVTQ